MINGKQERFEKILRVRYKNVNVHKGRRAAYICLVVLYFVMDVIDISLGLPTLLSGMYSGMSQAEAGALLPFMFSLFKAAIIGVIFVILCAQLFGSDRANNQMGIEQRSGYDNSDLFLSRLVVVAIAYCIILIIFGILDGGLSAGLKNNQKMAKSLRDVVCQNMQPTKDGKPELRNSLSDSAVILDYLANDVWYGLIAFILCSGITIGCTYIMNTGGSAAMGTIFGIGLTVLIISASVGTFTKGSAGGIGSNVPSFGWYAGGLIGFNDNWRPVNLI